MKCDNIKDEHNLSGFTKVEDDKFKIKITVKDRTDGVCLNCGGELEHGSKGPFCKFCSYTLFDGPDIVD